MIIGISNDPLDLQQKFTDVNKLNFPLFADTQQKVSKAFDVGKSAAKRSTFIIDKQGNIAKAWLMVKDAGGHPQEVLDFVKERFGKK